MEQRTQANNKQQQQRPQQQQLLLPQQHQRQVNTNSSKTMLAQEEEALNNKKQNKMTYSLSKRWLLFLSMTSILIITAILVATLTISVLDNDDQCFNNIPFQQPSYKFFATKTAYATAYAYLNQSKTDNKNDNELPSIFSKSDTLKALNEQLVAKDGCKARQLHFFGRHAARYPSKKGIEEINRHMNNVQARIDLSKYTVNKSNNSNNNKSNVCFNPLAQYKQWTTFLVPDLGNQVMDSGFTDSMAIARRLKSIYPDMFNANVAKIEVGTTEELRTAQTALSFLKQVDNFSPEVCSIEKFSTGESGPEMAASTVDGGGKAVDESASNDCYNLFLKKFHKDKLQFHKRCESYHKDKIAIPYHLDLKEPNRTQPIANSVSKKLKLAKDEYLTIDETDAIYKVCKYETAYIGSSIWCNLFSDKELKFFEYLSDVDDFFNQAFGHPDQGRSACPVTTELMKSFKSAKNPARAQAEANFYFTHAEVIQRIIAASVELEQDPEYAPNTTINYLKTSSTPATRQWRTSLLSPFSANIAFALYECPKAERRPDEVIEFNVQNSNLKVVASLNEQPILLDGCSNRICDLNELVTDSRIDREKRCKLEDICKKDIIIT